MSIIHLHLKATNDHSSPIYTPNECYVQTQQDRKRLTRRIPQKIKRLLCLLVWKAVGDHPTGLDFFRCESAPMLEPQFARAARR